MLCPRCKTEYENGDVFCANCGLDLRTAARTCPTCGARLETDDVFCANCGSKVEVTQTKEIPVTAKSTDVEEAETALTRQLIKEIASSFECSYLSPLSSLYHGGKKEKVGKSPINEALLQVILEPEKAFYLTGMTREKSYQKVLLINDGTYYRWIDEDGRVVITREESPWKFLESICTDVTQNVTEAEPSLVVLKQKQVEILKGIDALCQALTEMKVVPAFTTLTQLKSFLGSGEEITGQVRELSQQHFIKLIGYDNPVITIEARGQEIVRALVDYDVYYTIQVLTEGVDEYPSFHLLARGSRLYMLTNPENGEDIVVRTLDASGLRSLINWAWLADLTLEDIIPKMEATEKAAPAEPKDAKAAARTAPPSGFCPKCGAPLRPDASFCMKCGGKL